MLHAQRSVGFFHLSMISLAKVLKSFRENNVKRVCRNGGCLKSQGDGATGDPCL